jgi:hypothetical protein
MNLDSRQREAIGTVAIFVAAALLALIATVLTRFGITAMRGLDEVGADPQGGAAGLPIVALSVAGFLYLTAFTFVLLPLALKRKSRKATPPGFTFVSSLFDGFWKLISGLFTDRSDD